jgi:hypothetical protein
MLFMPSPVAVAVAVAVAATAVVALARQVTLLLAALVVRMVFK